MEVKTNVNATWFYLSNLLRHWPESASEVNTTISTLQQLYSNAPRFMRYPDGPFGSKRPYLVFRSHLLSDEDNFRMAKENIESTGMYLDQNMDETYLKFILEFYFGWAATSKPHHNDAWVKYVRHQFGKNDLIPILDNMTWPEEIDRLPGDWSLRDPELILFANRNYFYVYDYSHDDLMKAGSTLEEVYNGLLKRKWSHDAEDEKWWPSEKSTGFEYNTDYYFPMWHRRMENGKMTSSLVETLRDFKPKISNESHTL